MASDRTEHGALPIRLEGRTLVRLDEADRVELGQLEEIVFDEARAKGAFVFFVFALLLGPVCGGGAFIIHWFLGIVFALLPILIGIVLLTVGVIRRPRLVLTADGEERVWVFPHDVDFEAVAALVEQVRGRLSERESTDSEQPGPVLSA